jgi:hypothetical protein
LLPAGIACTVEVQSATDALLKMRATPRHGQHQDRRPARDEVQGHYLRAHLSSRSPALVDFLTPTSAAQSMQPTGCQLSVSAARDLTTFLFPLS